MSQRGGSEDRDETAEQLPYFHHRIHRVDAQPLLKRNGDFILRRMRHDGQERYVVSDLWSGYVRHFPIVREEGQFRFEAKWFDKIKDLIEYHVDTGTPLTHALGARLERGIIREEWELLSKQIETRKLLGKGNFGSVFEAELTMADGGKVVVAVKKTDGAAEESEANVEAARVAVLEEARTMRNVSGHENIVRAYGVTIDQELPMTVMEIVRGASLHHILLHENTAVDVRLRLLTEAVNGLRHVHNKGYLHRDVAARNCLVEKKGPILGRLKITDFGMARYVGEQKQYQLKTALHIPIAWAAIESLEHFLWTVESDVWSIGVLVWEAFNDGSMPYNEFDKIDLASVLPYLKAGNRLEIPKSMPPEVAAVVKKCWEADPSKRPTTTTLIEVFTRAAAGK